MLLDRFLTYVKIDTQSDEQSLTTPSSMKQFDLLNLLQKELNELGVENELTDTGRLYAYLPGNDKYDAIGFCAHVDTAQEFPDKDVKPRVIKNYDGGDIKLGETDRVLSPTEYSKLNKLIGKTLVVTDGTTLLGADDKAGLAIIMEVLVGALKLNAYERRPMYILFTPDEEIGRGAEIFDTSKFKAKFAYTFDGADPHEINIETFNAKSAKISIVGKAIHTGDAKGILINAGLVANEFNALLPKRMIPAKTEGHQGFNHLVSIEGTVDNANLFYILRNHDNKKLEKQVLKFVQIKDKLINVKYGNDSRNYMDIYIPKNKTTTQTYGAVLYIHGGAWIEGNKYSMQQYAIDYAKKGYLYNFEQCEKGNCAKGGNSAELTIPGNVNSGEVIKSKHLIFLSFPH